MGLSLVEDYYCSNASGYSKLGEALDGRKSFDLKVRYSLALNVQ